MLLKRFFFLNLFAAFVFFRGASLAQPSDNDSSQHIISKSFYTVESGLASREVFCGIQDNDGFMWFGTRNGLNRYDGKNFKLFTRQKNGLASNRIIQLAKDNHDHLFLVYGNPGYARSAMHTEVMDLKTHEIRSLKQVFPDLPFDEKYLYWVANGGDDLCFLISKPFQYWRYSKGKFELKCEMRKWDNLSSKPADLITANGAYHTTTGFHCMFKKDYAVLFLSNPDVFYYVTPDRVILENSPFARGIIAITPGKDVLLNTSSHYSLLDSNGILRQKIRSFNPPFLCKPSEIYFRKSSSDEMMTYSQENGLYLYDFKFWYKLFDKKELKIGSGNSLYGFYKDNQNNFWVFTASGVFKIKTDKNPFKHYFSKTQLNDNSENQVRGIYADSVGRVFASVWSNMAVNDEGKNVLIYLDKKSIKYGIYGHDNKVYVGDQGSLYSYDFSNNLSLKIFDEKILSEIWTIDVVKPDKLLLGCSENLLGFDLIGRKTIPIVYSSEKIPEAGFVFRFLKREDKKIWAVTQKGLYLLDESGSTVLDFYGKQSAEVTHQLPFDEILDGYEDKDGIFWLASGGEGLFRWDKRNPTTTNPSGTFQQFNSATGLPSDILYRIEADEYNNLWISTDNGLVRFNKKDFKTDIYTTADGLSHNEFNRTSSYKAPDGRLFFGGLDGVNAFYPKDFSGNSTIEDLPLHIISFNKFSAEENKLIDKTDELLSENKIILKPSDRFFNLEFQLLDFEEGKLNYAYKITGVDKDWNFINENSIRISGLPYGNFLLQIKAQSHSGQWSKKELSIPIHVLKPFYLQAWFVVLFLVILLVVIFLILSWRTKRLIKAKQDLETTVLERTEQLKTSLGEKEVLLKEIHHRVKNNLQVISALLEMQGSRTQDEKTKAAITESQNRVLSIAFIHQNLYQHEDIKSVEIHSFVDELSKHIQNVFEKPGCIVVVQNNIPQTFLDIDTAVPLGLIINELLTNSYKYAFSGRHTGEINITLTDAGDGAYNFEYADNGIGLPKDFDVQKANSLGLRLVRQLCKQLAGKINYSFNNGCKFECTIKDMEARSKM